MAEVRVTHLGALAELEQDASVSLTLLGVLAELGIDTLRITLLGVLLEIEEVIIPVPTYFHNAGPAPHLLLPDPTTGYQLDEHGSFWSIVLPQTAKNLVTDGSFELGSTGDPWTIAGFTSPVVTSEKVSRGFRALKGPTSGSNGTVQLAFWISNTGWHTFSLDLYHTAGQRFTLEIGDSSLSTIYASRSITAQETGWQRYSLSYHEGAGSLIRRARLTSLAANTGTIYTDGWMVVSGNQEITYFDGDSQDEGFDPNPYAFSWTGAAHSSTSVSASRVHNCGQIISFYDLGFLTTAIVGLGMLDPEQDLIVFSDGQEMLRGNLIQGKDFSIVGRLYAKNHQILSGKRQSLIDVLNILNSESGLVTLAYQPVDRTGEPEGKRLWITCSYLGGMSGNLDNLYQDTVELRFRLHSARVCEEFGNAVILSHDGYGGVNTSVYRRDALTGEWEEFVVGGAGVSGGTINTVAVLDNGTIVAGGTFTSIGGVTARRIAFYSPETGLWTEPGLGLNGTVEKIIVGKGILAGQAIIVGNFTANGAGAGTFRRAVVWTGVAFSELDSGLNANIVDVDTSSDGKVYAVGTFTARNSGGTMLNFAYFDGRASGDAAWHNLMPAIAGGTPKTVQVSPDHSKVYIGGDFSSIDADNGKRCIAQYNVAASSFSALEAGLSAQVLDLAIAPDGYLYMVGDFVLTSSGVARVMRRIARWTGANFEEIGNGELNVSMHRIAFDRRGNMYIAGTQNEDGNYVTASETVLFQWNGAAWVSPDLRALNASVPTLGHFFVQPNGNLFVTTLGSTDIALAGHTEVDYEGSADALIKFTMIGPGVLHRISNWTLDAHIYFKSLKLEVNEQFYLDLTGSVPKAWTNFRPNVLDQIIVGVSDLHDFRLMPGSNHITVTVSGTTDSDTQCILAWKNHHWSIDAAS